MLLQNKVVLVFAGAGAIGAGFAKEASRLGATVVVTARTLAAAERAAHGLVGTPKVLAVDALEVDQVRTAFETVVRDFGRVDAVFNAIGGRPRELGYPARSLDVSLHDFMIPLERIVLSQFLTAREGAKAMSRTGGGALVLLSATLSRMTAANMAGITAACGAIESLTRALAGDFASAGVRVNCVRGSAMPETRTIQETGAGIVALGGSPPMTPPPIGRPITVAETAAAAAFLASDAASGITGQVLTVCGGAFV